jgi:hypothetical protein
MGAAAKMLAQDAERVQVQVQVTTGGIKKRGCAGNAAGERSTRPTRVKAGQRKWNDKYGDKAT